MSDVIWQESLITFAISRGPPPIINISLPPANLPGEAQFDISNQNLKLNILFMVGFKGLQLNFLMNVPEDYTEYFVWEEAEENIFVLKFSVSTEAN